MDVATVKDAVTDAVSKAFDREQRHTPNRKLSRYPENMTVGMVAAYFSCDPQHVTNLYDQGLLLGTNIAARDAQKRALRFKRDDVAAFEEAARQRDFTTANVFSRQGDQPKGAR